ncbi:hypothetical protein DXG03_003963 [Asterophora parasitica]|uniref:DUF7330 domain-containing protein n=1 Tax=Asterophora parasitica TaxID=117018 RepID=A0A9P7G756_9AGAR|nr:hypothetical protein DXG03_003963 [Asterophora parasitica]
MVEVPAVNDDPPPTYTAASPPSSSPGPIAEASATHAKLPAVKPSNYVAISRSNGSIKGVWVLDPNLAIPATLLPPLSTNETEETRRHFNVSASNGVIDADITLAPLRHEKDSQKPASRRTTIYAHASNGSVITKLHDTSDPRSSFYLNISASNGSVHIHLPRSFHGLLVLKTWNGSVKFSPESLEPLTTFSDVDKTRRCFIGDYSEMTDEWQGDEVFVEARNGSVKLYYDDEAKKGERKSGFFERLFGF